MSANLVAAAVTGDPLAIAELVVVLGLLAALSDVATGVQRLARRRR